MSFGGAFELPKGKSNMRLPRPKVKIRYMEKMNLILTSDVRRSQTLDW